MLGQRTARATADRQSYNYNTSHKVAITRIVIGQLPAR